MSVENFLKLKEIDSLSKMRINHLRLKEEQENRLSKLNIRRQEALVQTEKLQQEIFDLNHQMSSLETKLKTASEQKQRLIDLGGDETKIKIFSGDIQRLEDDGFLLLEKAEAHEQEISELKTFIKGLDKTIDEIKAEAHAEIESINSELNNLELRINLLKEELPSDYRQLLEKMTAKKLAHGPFTRIEQGSCYFCRYKISRIDESEIDMQKNLKQCPQCSRIFLPYGS